LAISVFKIEFEQADEKKTKSKNENEKSKRLNTLYL